MQPMASRVTFTLGHNTQLGAGSWELNTGSCELRTASWEIPLKVIAQQAGHNYLSFSLLPWADRTTTSSIRYVVRLCAAHVLEEQ